VPVWSAANIGGVQLKDYCPICGMQYDKQYLDGIFEQVKNAAYKIIDLKGSTYYDIGLGLTRIVESIIRDENAILTVSSLLHDYYGVNNVCLSTPSIVNKDGIVQAIKLPLENGEIKMFQESAAIMTKLIQSLDI
jgi:L-lactate dehydrogenase